MERGWWDRLAAALAARGATTLDDGDRTRAAVLIPLQAADDGVHIVYTRRSPNLPQHAGQVAFPGGTREPGDATLAATALREAREEIGLAPEDVTILGRLDDIDTVSTRFVISPFVARVPHPYAWAPRPSEVDAIFSVPLPQLLAPDAERRELWDLGGRAVPVAHFPVGDHVIWGATHRITRSLLDLLRSV
jgi:8-oxo-dGTP pyrophosphatase MutT (NUDIX family)